MKRRSRVGFIFLGLLALIMLGLVGLTWRQVRQDRLNQSLIAAIKRHDLPQVLAMLNQGADGNARDLPADHQVWYQRLYDLALHKRTDGENAPTALFLALTPPVDEPWSPVDPRFVTTLLAHGADVNEGDGEGNTPLIRAAMGGDIAMVQILLRYGPHLEARDDTGKTALQWAKSLREAIRKAEQMSRQNLSFSHSTMAVFMDITIGHGPTISLPDSTTYDQVIRLLKQAGARN